MIKPIYQTFINTCVKLVVVVFFLLLPFQSGCGPPSIAGPEFTSRNIKNIDVWFLMIDQLKGSLSRCYNIEVGNAVVDALTRKGYSVRHSGDVNDPDWLNHIYCFISPSLVSYAAMVRKQYLNGQASPDIDAVLFVRTDILHEIYLSESGIAPPDIASITLHYFVFEPTLTLKEPILLQGAGLGGDEDGRRHAEALPGTVYRGPLSLKYYRWHFTETERDYARRLVDLTFVNLPSVSNQKLERRMNHANE
jgi:hypothetical protein